MLFKSRNVYWMIRSHKLTPHTKKQCSDSQCKLNHIQYKDMQLSTQHRGEIFQIIQTNMKFTTFTVRQYVVSMGIKKMSIILEKVKIMHVHMQSCRLRTPLRTWRVRRQRAAVALTFLLSSASSLLRRRSSFACCCCFSSEQNQLIAHTKSRYQTDPFMKHIGWTFINPHVLLFLIQSCLFFNCTVFCLHYLVLHACVVNTTATSEHRHQESSLDYTS